MIIDCIELFTIALCICCLWVSKFILIKNKKRTKLGIIMFVVFLILQLISMLVEDFSLYKNIVEGLSSIIICFMIINYFNKQRILKKQFLFFYIFFKIVELTLNMNNIYFYMDDICDLVILVLIFYKIINLYNIDVYNKYKNTKAKLHRLNINAKIYNIKLDTLRQKNIRRENILKQNISNIKQLTLNSNSEVYFIDQTLTYVYEYNFDNDNICKINSFKSFFNKVDPVNLIILEKFYNTLYRCEDSEFQMKQGENEYYHYTLYPNILLQGTLGVLFVKSNVNYKNNIEHEYHQNSSRFKNIIENMPYDIILEKNNKILYQNKESKYSDNMMNIILDKNIKGNITYSVDGNDNDKDKVFIDRIKFENTDCTLIVLKNIAEKNSLVDKMNLAKQKYELFVDIISEAVFVLDYNTNKIKYTNKSFDRILQKYKLSIGDMYDLIKNTDLNYCDISFNMKFESKKIINSLNEDIYLEFANMVLNINKKNIMIGVFRDVTQDVKNEIMQKQMEEDSYTKKLKNEFLINLSHELKTPVNLIYLKNQLTRSICEK
ncbi:hypothetical protein, partial [Intestinibacter sp.]